MKMSSKDEDVSAIRGEAPKTSEVSKISKVRHPVVTFCRRYFKMGAVLSVNPPVFDAGVNAGEMGREVLEGKDPENMPAGFVETAVVLANPEIAGVFGVNLIWEREEISYK